MPIEFSQIIIFLGLASVVGLVIYNFRLNNRSSPPEADEQKSYKIIHDAIKKAQAILASAELGAIKEVAETKMVLREELTQAEQEYLNYLKFLKENADSAKNAGDEAIRQRVENIFVKFEERLSDFLAQTQKESVEAIDLEIKAARQLLDTYKQQQLKMIDENIVAMLERTLALVLAKKLTLSDQVDLIYEALERAKAEKFII